MPSTSAVPPDAAATPTTTSAGKGLGILPQMFSGDRTKVQTLFEDIDDYIEINKDLYNTDTKKIILFLSLLRGGEAEAWKKAWNAEHYADAIDANSNAIKTKNYGTAAKFTKAFSKAFLPTETKNQAFFDLRNLKQGKASAAELNTKFNELIRTAEIPTTGNESVLIDYYMNALNGWLQEKIMGLDTLPTTLTTWQHKAVEFDTHRANIAHLLGKSTFAQPERRNWWSNAIGCTTAAQAPAARQYHHDPNAMDVDAISTNEQTRRRALGLCYNCGKKGHVSRNCPDKKDRLPPKKKFTKGRDLLTHIRELVVDLDEGEREEMIRLGGEGELGF